MECTKCEDTGWFAYDHNHSTVCDACCKHDQGWWLLTESHSYPGMHCCRNGCGYIKERPDKPGLTKYTGPRYQ